MEDVAHGSLDYYGGYSFGDAITGEGRVKGVRGGSRCIVASQFAGIYRGNEEMSDSD